MKLVKVDLDHYVIVTNDKIKINDYYLDDTNLIRKLNAIDDKDYLDIEKIYRKITHSNFFMNFDTLKVTLNEPIKKLTSVEPLDLNYVKNLIGDVSIKSLAEEIIIENNFFENEEKSKQAFIFGFFEGYDKCLKINKESIKTPIEWDVYFDENNNLKLKK